MYNHKLPICGTTTQFKQHLLKVFGFVFGPIVDEDFIAVNFPSGWKQVPHEELPSLSWLKDGENNRRAKIVISSDPKQCSIYFRHRFKIELLPNCLTYSDYQEREGEKYRVVLLDWDKVIFEKECPPIDTSNDENIRSAVEAYRKLALDFLKVNGLEFNQGEIYFEK